MSDVPEALVERAAVIVAPKTWDLLFGDDELIMPWDRDEPDDDDATLVRELLAALHSEGLIYWATEIETRAEESVRRILDVAHSEGHFYWAEELEAVLLHPDDAASYGLDNDTPVYRLRRDTP